MRMVRRWTPVLGALLVAAATLGLSAWRRPPVLYQETVFVLDTYVRVQVASPNGAAAVAAARTALEATEQRLNRYDPASDLSRLNATAPGTWISLDPLTARALDLARAGATVTGGAFDITLGRALDLYRFGGGGQVPSETDLRSAMAATGATAWEVDGAAGRARRLHPDATLDVGGLHKGLAVDLAGAALRAHGASTGLLDASGNMLALGPRPDGGPWRIGIAHPRRPGQVIAVVPLEPGQAISTSGDYQQFFEVAGVRYHHILDPRSGRPSRAGAISVTVLAPTAAQADILSTAFFVLGPEQGLALAETLPDVEAVFVTDELRVIASPGLRARLEVK